MNNNPFSVADTDIDSAAQQPHRNQEDKVACLQICVMSIYEC